MLHPNLATGLLVLLSLGHTGLHAQSKHVLIIGLDGVRTDALKLADTPNIDALVATGAVTWDAFAGGAFEPSDPTHQATSSGPGWSSILTGVWVDKHGVSDNSFGGNNLANYPHFFAHVKAALPSNYLSSIVNWDPINDNLLAPFPGLADFTKEVNSDNAVETSAVSHLASADPNALFLHFDDCDGAGHSSGFSPSDSAYISTIEKTDEHIGGVLAAVQNRPNYANEDWVVLLSSDHGGNLTSHGGHSPGERAIWIVAQGPGIAPGTYSPGPGHTALARTALHHLGVPYQTSFGFADSDPFGFPQQDASYPVPRHGAENHPADASLGWAGGDGALSHDVYLGESPTLGAPEFQGNVSQADFSPAGLSPETTYYWRIDTVTPAGTLSGTVWNFTTAGPILKDIILHFDFEQDTLDASKNANNGTVFGNPAYGAGHEGFAIDLDGNGDFVSVGHPADFNFGSNTDFSVSLWINSNGWSGDPVFIGNKNWNSGSNQGWLLAGESDGTNWQWNYKGSGGSRLDYDRAGAIADGVWHHIAVTHDRDGLVSFYQDGALLTAGFITGLGSINTSLSTAFGQDGTLTYADDLNGKLDEVRVWRRCLGAAEVADLFGAGPDAVWNPLIGGTEGTYGEPVLAGSGPVTAGSATSLDLSSARENSSAFFVFGFEPLNAPLFGGLLVPVPDIILALSTSALGTASLSTTWPSGIPAGIQAWFQAWVQDPAGPNGFAASNALSVTTP